MRDGVHEPDRVAFCLTPVMSSRRLRHPDPETYAATMSEFDRILGLERLRCFHFNDSKKGCVAR